MQHLMAGEEPSDLTKDMRELREAVGLEMHESTSNNRGR